MTVPSLMFMLQTSFEAYLYKLWSSIAPYLIFYVGNHF
jgi:hypothetical protein